jgi:hypothetical protein
MAVPRRRVLAALCEGNFMSAQLSVLVDPSGHLLCPRCGDDYVHVDDVFVAGRPREDGPVFPVHVNSDGNVREGQQVSLPVSADRRHSIGVQGWCEKCSGRFVIEFRQHKGQTLVDVLEERWVSVAHGGAEE